MFFASKCSGVHIPFIKKFKFFLCEEIEQKTSKFEVFDYKYFDFRSFFLRKNFRKILGNLKYLIKDILNAIIWKYVKLEFQRFFISKKVRILKFLWNFVQRKVGMLKNFKYKFFDFLSFRRKNFNSQTSNFEELETKYFELYS